MADGATFAHGLVFEHMRTALGVMAPEAAFICGEGGEASGQVSGTLMRIMAVTAIQSIVSDGVMTGLKELGPGIQVAIQADGHVLAWIQDLGDFAGIGVEAAGAVAGFATDGQGVIAVGLEARMIGGAKGGDQLLVTIGAHGRAHILGTGDVRRGNDGSGESTAGNGQRRQAKQSQGREKHTALPKGNGAWGSRGWLGGSHELCGATVGSACWTS